jgi:dTMP kinase
LINRDDVIFTREPGGTDVAEEIRNLVLSKRGRKEPINPLTELFLFCAARAQHVAGLIKPALDAGKHVICDRFDASTIAYQIYGRNRKNLLGEFDLLNSTAKGNIKPNLVIYLDVTSESVKDKKRDY